MATTGVLIPKDFAHAIKLPSTSASLSQQEAFPSSLTRQAHSTLDDVIGEVRYLARSGKLHDILNTQGAIYFQNLDLKDAEEFSQFAHAFGWEPHEDIGNPVRRTIHAKNVASANEGPNTQPVYPHNEFGLSPHYPAYVLFFCVQAPDSGGTTPINNSTLLFERLEEKHPSFIRDLQQKGSPGFPHLRQLGVKYQLTYPNGPKDQVESAGTTVRQSYGLHVLDEDDTETARAKVESEIRRLPTATWEWINRSEENPLGDLRVWQVLPAIRDHPRTGRPAFFNNIVSRFLNAVDNGTLSPPHLDDGGRYKPPAFYGDGSLIPTQYLQSAVDIINETRALVSWTPGDVLLLDNHTVQHAREPWTGDRKLLASLWDDPSLSRE